MIQRCQHIAGGVLAFLVLAVLHLVHGSTLILALVLHLSHHVRLTLGHTSASSCSSPSTLKDDIRLWKSRKKQSSLPRCLAVVFVPSARGHFSLKELRYKPYEEKVVYRGMQEDALDLIRWTSEMEVDHLLLYDENGLFKQYSSQLQEAIRASLFVNDSSTDKLEVLSEDTFIMNNSLRIKLLSREDGKEHLAAVTRGISKGVSGGFVTREEIDVDYVQEKLYSSLCPEPDLLIVLGGLHLRLRGFPPWHTRLCEIYHDSSLSLLGPPRLRYSTFRRAMDNYAGCQQRYGR